MADDRTRAHAAAGPDEEIHDDDELAAALAAELDRIAPTGAVPVLRASAVPFGPVRPEATPPAQPVENRPSAGRQPVVAGPAQPSSVRRSAEPEGSATPSRRVASTAPERQGPPNEGDRPEALAPRSARRHAPSATPEAATPEPHHRHVETSARHSDREARGARLQAVPAGSGAAQGTPVEADVPLAPPPPVRATRAPSFSTTAEPRPEPAPGRRRAADPEPPSTQPVVIPEAVRPISESALPPPPDLQDPLRETGPLALPPTLYDSWEQSLRSIGRPRSDDWLDSTVADHSDADAATISLSRAALGPLPEPPAREPAAEIVTPAAEEAATVPEPRRRGRAGRAARVELPGAAPEPVAGPVPAVAAATTVSHTDPPVVDSPPLAEEESDGVDEVDTGIRAVSAADTASVPLPPMIEQAAPVSGAIPVVVPRDTTEAKDERRVPLGGASLLALLLVWCGALASPALFLAGFGLAAGGGGGAAAGALVLGVALALPAAVRLTAASDADRAGSPAIASRVFGPRGGPAVAAVLLAARLLAAVLALLGVADLAAAFTARTGVGGTSSSAASVTAVLVAGLAALLAVAWPRRTTRIVLGVLAVLALLVAVIVLVVTAPAVATAVPTAPPAVSTVTGGAVGFAVPGLLLTATVADATLLAAGRRRGRGAAVAIVLAAIVGLVILVLALAVGRGAGASGDGATAFAGVVADATPASAAVPLGVALLVAALPLPALLLATSGDAAAVLIGAGRSARLGSVAAGLLVLAVTLALFAVGLTAPSALATLGPVLGVPVAVWTGVVTLAPLRSPATRSVRATAFVAAAIATVIGWLLVDGLLVPGERSPVLDLLRIPLGSAWRGGPALGVLVAFVLGLLAAVLARAAASRAAAPPASRLRSSGGQAVDSVEG
ncbi:hypothetical protein [Amnibacterium sp.]|uniref:hypothetical protein n=1 Tax=Amnibacterium sp. TaxID=1872496 RepID=UPI00260BF378|nr:hypothetical protein [Amnibacterium sp.]